MSHSNERITAAVAPSQDWRTAYPFVEGEAKRVLDGLPEGSTVSTKALVDAIYSPALPQDERVHARLFKALNACALKGLKAYMTLGEEETIGNFGRGRRKLWHRAIAGIVATCKSCGRPL